MISVKLIISTGVGVHSIKIAVDGLSDVSY